jgi:hypothetical protein
MSLARQRSRAARSEALGPGLSRAQRFAARLRGRALPSFDTLRQVPLAWLHREADLPRVALAAGLLHYRRQLDAELSGPRLAPIVAMCGEELLDRVCAATPPPPEQCAAASRMPAAGELLMIGHSLLNRTDEEWARALAARAFSLVGTRK